MERRKAAVAVPRQMFAEILSLIARLRAPPAPVLVAHGHADPPGMKPVVGCPCAGGEIGRFYGASEPAY